MKTQRVRIPIIMCDDLTWASAGAGGPRAPGELADCQQVVEDIREEMKIQGELRWIEADVPIPESMTVEGEVVDGD